MSGKSIGARVLRTEDARLLTGRGEVVFKQIAGWVARRVLCWKAPGDQVARLRARFPHITFQHSTSRETDLALFVILSDEGNVLPIPADGVRHLGFTIDQDLELRAADASKASVRYAHHNLGGKEIRDHISTGKTVVRLGLTWNDRISFVLTEQYHIKRVTFLDILRREDLARRSAEQGAELSKNFPISHGCLMLREAI